MTYTKLLYVLLFILVPALAFAGGNQEDGTNETQNSPQLEMESDAERIEVEEAVAVVNGEEITREEFENLMDSNIARFEAQSGREFTDQQRPQLQRQVFEGLISRTILEQEADRLDISVGDERFEEALAQFIGRFPNEEAYLNALDQQGFTEDEFEEELRRQMVIDELLRSEVYESIDITEDEMREFYEENPQYFEQAEQVEARHIIIQTEGNEDEATLAEKRARLEEIREEIVSAGADFGDMAREHSEGPSASRGGDLGTFGRGRMVQAFEQTAFDLDVGEVSEVFQTQFGYHIVEVTDRIPAESRSYEESIDQIEQFMVEDEQNRGAQEYVRQLREEAEIQELIDLEPVPPQEQGAE